jgi:hypothetical protein
VADLALDPTVVEEQVRRLNRQADSLGFLGVVLGAPFGAVIGGFPLVAHGPIPSKFGIATLLLGALLTGTLGYILARGRSFGYRLKAQLLLGQLRLEQNVEALLAVSERPLVPALPAAEPMHALPEAPRIDELLDAGLAMPTAAPVVDYTPPAEPEEIAPEPEPEPVPSAEPSPLPSWAADLEQVLTRAVPTLVPPAAPAPAAAAPEPEPEPEATPAWTLPVREEPVRDERAPEPIVAAFADPQEIAPAPAPAPVAMPEPVAVPEPVAMPEPIPTPEPVGTPEPVRMPEPTPPPAWAVPAAEYRQPEPEPEVVPPASPAPPDLSTMSIAEIARLGESHAIAPAPTPAPVATPEPTAAPAWAVPTAKQEEPEESEETSPAASPAPDLRTMSISEIARLADAGSL